MHRALRAAPPHVPRGLARLIRCVGSAVDPPAPAQLQVCAPDSETLEVPPTPSSRAMVGTKADILDNNFIPVDPRPVMFFLSKPGHDAILKTLRNAYRRELVFDNAARDLDKKLQVPCGCSVVVAVYPPPPPPPVQ